METSMNHYENEYKAWLVDLINGVESCQIEPPVEIIEIIKQHTKPNFSFDDELFQQLDTLNLPKFYPYEPTDRFTTQEKQQIVMLIAWLISGLRKWSKQHDSDYSQLKTFLIILNSFDDNSYLYEILPSAIKENTELLDDLQRLISNFKCNLSTKSNGTPICIHEAVIAFEEAISNKNWVKISESLRIVEQSIYHNFLMAEIIKLLAALDFTRLCNAFCSSQDVMILRTSAYALTTEQNLLLAVSSDNPFVEFVIFYSVVSKKGNIDKFSADEESQIVTILEKVSKDVVRFKAWMDIFNKYPILQTALGLFLAKSKNDSIFDIYINSIDLTSSSKICRESEECFDTFRKNAAIENRKILWKKAYQRWSEWKFETNMPNKYLFRVSFSILDCALIGYFLECLSEDEINNYRQDILDKMSNIRLQWYKEQSDFITQGYLLLSQFQPVIHTSKVIENDSWIMKDIYYMPNQFSDNAYFEMLLN